MLLKQPGHSAKRTEILKLRRRKKDDLSEMPGFLSGGFPFKSVVKRACLVLRLGKCFTCACLPILFGGKAQNLYKITVSKGDICKHAK